MPVMDGFKASQQIKSMVKDGTMNDMIIIACTAIPDDAELQRKIREHKMDDYIPKPILKSHLKNTIFKYYKMVHGTILCPFYWKIL